MIVNDVHVDPKNPRRVLLATDRSGVLESNDAALSFKASNAGFSERHVTALLVDAKGYRIEDPDSPGKPFESEPSAGSASSHVQNFLDCVKSRERPNADIEIGHLSGWGQGLYNGVSIFFPWTRGNVHEKFVTLVVRGKGKLRVKIGSVRVGYRTVELHIG